MASRKCGGGRRGGKPAKATNPKWTKQRLDIFFAELAEICNVAGAARRAGFPDGESAYKRKTKDPDFRARYDAAVAEGYARLELEMLERSRFGENRAADQGESGPKQREIPTALALSLLKLHSSKVRAAAPAPTRRPLRGAKLRDALEARLSEINRRLGGEG